ncbi:hypothetical protein DB346_13460 [Verrucomicrobia bacterium LW23]|nr:hypothetical protein DB346_13460 [Verrucomicrobia bacterium LW23]
MSNDTNDSSPAHATPRARDGRPGYPATSVATALLAALLFYVLSVGPVCRFFATGPSGKGIMWISVVKSGTGRTMHIADPAQSALITFYYPLFLAGVQKSSAWAPVQWYLLQWGVFVLIDD